MHSNTLRGPDPWTVLRRSNGRQPLLASRWLEGVTVLRAGSGRTSAGETPALPGASECTLNASSRSAFTLPATWPIRSSTASRVPDRSSAATSSRLPECRTWYVAGSLSLSHRPAARPEDRAPWRTQATGTDRRWGTLPSMRLYFASPTNTQSLPSHQVRSGSRFTRLPWPSRDPAAPRELLVGAEHAPGDAKRLP